MFEELSLELMISLIKSLAVPGNTGFELLGLGVLIALLIWKRRRKK